MPIRSEASGQWAKSISTPSASGQGNRITQPYFGKTLPRTRSGQVLAVANVTGCWRLCNTTFVWGKSSLHRWVLAQQKQCCPQAEQLWAIEPQCFHRRSPSGCETKNLGVRFVPVEMLPPLLLAWMKKRDKLFGNRVKRLSLDCFVGIATLTSQRQIFKIITSALHRRNDVLSDQRLRGEVGSALAVFATAIGPPKNEAPIRA